VHQFNWSPGIGDPTALGWLTVVLYFLTAWLCWRMVERLRSHHREGRPEINTWRAISVLFMLLGINKQLDLQTAFTELCRVLAHKQGWYPQRLSIQLAFIVLVALICLGAALFLVFRSSQAVWPNWLAVLGTILVLGYVFVRASSFHHIDQFIGRELIGMRWNWILEIGGIALVLFASLRRSHMMTLAAFEPAGGANPSG
jgi:hypothetical protein